MSDFQGVPIEVIDNSRKLPKDGGLYSPPSSLDAMFAGYVRKFQQPPQVIYQLGYLYFMPVPQQEPQA